MNEQGSPARRSQAPSSISTAATGARKLPVADFDFNLGVSKARISKALDPKVPGPFRKFYASALYDRLLQTSLLYFIAKFMHDWMVKAMDKARKIHLEGYNPYQIAVCLRELEEEMDVHRMELSPTYSEIILKYSTYEKPQQDKAFFESMYNTLIDIVDEACGKLAKREEVEAEIGLLFRTRHFNINQRRNQPARSVDTLSVKELYSLKHETSNRALNAKMLSSLYEKPESLGVQLASVSNSPLITQYIVSPIVARSKTKDPIERKKAQAELQRMQRDTNHAKGHSPQLSTVFKSAAMLQGVDINTLRDDLHKMKPSAATAEAAGLLGEDRAYKSHRPQKPAGTVAPETAGLPPDEMYNHLALLKRYILYGPTLGLNMHISAPSVGQNLYRESSISPAPGMPGGKQHRPSESVRQSSTGGPAWGQMSTRQSEAGGIGSFHD